MKYPLGLQSYCLREFKDNVRAASMVRECGLAAIEVWKGHIDFQNADTHAEAIKTYANAGVRIVSTGVNLITPMENDAINIFTFAKTAGVTMISVDFKLEGLDESLEVAERLSEKFGISLAIHNHGGRHWLGNRESLRWIFHRTSKRIGLCLDTAWSIDSGEDPVTMVEEFSQRLFTLHLKDFTYKPDRSLQDVVVGSGNVSLPKLKAALEKTGFSGLMIIEYEAEPKNPVPSLQKCVKAVKAGLDGLFA
jgi:inosose dehydratase